MNLLAIETSSMQLSIALRKGKGPVHEVTVRGLRHQAENLFPHILGLLEKERITINDINIFLIDRGPGSFTGLRIGFATLKGFLAVGKKTCYGALSLDMIAENCRLEKNSRLAVGLDAYRGKIYARFYRKDDVWKPETKAEALTLKAFAGHLTAGTYIAGNVTRRYRTEIEKLTDGPLHYLDETLGYPRASALIHLYGRRRWGNCLTARRALKKLTELRDFLPVYLRRSEAEEKKEESLKESRRASFS